MDDPKPTRSQHKRQRGTGSVVLREGSSIWAYQIYVNGRRERGSTGQRNKRAAEAFVTTKLAEYAVGLSSPSSNKVTVQELMDDLLLRHKNDGNKREEDDEPRWGNHLQPFFGYRG